MARGELTPEVAEKMREFLNKEPTVKELRLIPYIVYRAVNEQYIELTKINREEVEILSEFCNKGYMTEHEPFMGDLQKVQFTMTKEFWDFCNEILWLGYVESKFKRGNK